MIKITRPYSYGIIGGIGFGLWLSSYIPPASGYAGLSILSRMVGVALIPIASSLMLWHQRRLAAATGADSLPDQKAVTG